MEKKSTTGVSMRKVFGYLVSSGSLNYGTANKVFYAYCKQYGIWMDDPAPDAVVLDVFAKYGRF